MMHLNSLKNHEILPYFVAGRNRVTRQGAGELEVSFVDLAGVKEALKRGDAAVGDSRELERLLYGTMHEPVFSGWAWTRLAAACEQVGFGAPSVVKRDGFTVVARMQVAPGADRGDAALAAARTRRAVSRRRLAGVVLDEPEHRLPDGARLRPPWRDDP